MYDGSRRTLREALRIAKIAEGSKDGILRDTKDAKAAKKTYIRSKGAKTTPRESLDMPSELTTPEIPC